MGLWRSGGSFFSPAELLDANLVGDDKDMERDGIFNLLEFVTGGNPKVSEPENRRPAASTRTEARKPYFVLKYRQNAELENASLLVEAGTDLTNWTVQPPGTPTGVADATSLELETKLESNRPAKFLRLKVRRVPAQP